MQKKILKISSSPDQGGRLGGNDGFGSDAREHNLHLFKLIYIHSASDIIDRASICLKNN